MSIILPISKCQPQNPSQESLRHLVSGTLYRAAQPGEHCGSERLTQGSLWCAPLSLVPSWSGQQLRPLWWANTLPGNYLPNAVIFEGEEHQQALAAQATPGVGPPTGLCHASPPQSSPVQAEVTTARLGPFCRHTQRPNWIASPSPWDCLNGLNCIKLGLFWSVLSVKFCHPIATSLCHRRDQQSNWKCFLETGHVVSAACWALSSPRDRNWKCFFREQQGLLNAW